MLTLEQIKGKLEAASVVEVSRATGVNKTTLHNLKNGTHDNPRLKTILALSEYFRVNNS